jgi:hypothetical protein
MTGTKILSFIVMTPLNSRPQQLPDIDVPAVTVASVAGQGTVSVDTTGAGLC